jgi:pimeloyl-ACP methyl ester carboxylesterase
VTTQPHDRPPPLALLARETLLFPLTRARASFAPVVKLNIQGGGRPVFVIPGFMASDRTTTRLRKSLQGAGFLCRGWGLGRNMGVASDIFARMDDRLSEMPSDAPVSLVGWSLGGVIAREYAKYAPHRIAKVITLGSPFSGSPRANNGWRVYERIAGHKVDSPLLDVTLCDKPPVPTISIWSSRDGMVAPQAACGLPHESDMRIEADCTHMGRIADPNLIRRVAQIITE